MFFSTTRKRHTVMLEYGGKKERCHVGKEKSSKLALDFPPIVSAAVVITSKYEPVSTADGDGTLTSNFSVSTVTTNTNVSTSITALKNIISYYWKSPVNDGKIIACLGDTLRRFIKCQKRPSSGTSSSQKHQSRSRYRDHYSYYRWSNLQSPQRVSKSSRHHYVYQHAGRSPSPARLLT